MPKLKHNLPSQADQSLITKRKTGKKLIKVGTLLVLSLVLFVSYSFYVRASIPDFVNYQGRLRDAGGNPVTVATTIQFSLYSHITNGAPGDVPGAAGPLLWTETYDGSGGCAQITPGTDGIFAQHLGDCVLFPAYLDFTQEYYLGVKIGADAEATPRVPLSTHPYAFTSKRVHVEAGDLFINNTDVAGDIIMNTAGGMQINGSNAAFQGVVYQDDYSANYTNRSLVDKEYVDEQLMWEILPANGGGGGMRIQPKNNSVRQIFVQRDDNSYTQFMVRNDNDAGNGAGAIIELKGSGADYTNNMYIGKYGASFWIPELRDNGAVLTDKTLVIGTASDTEEIHFVTGHSYTNLAPVVVADDEGFRYTSDLSATFVDRTLVDKAYVDGAVIAATNNIYANDGTLIGNRVVDSLNGYNTSTLTFTGNSRKTIEAIDGSNYGSVFLADSTGLEMYYRNGAVSKGFYFDNSDAIFTDTHNSKGLEYANDYSANYTNRTLVDKEYVDNAVIASTLSFENGLTESGGIVKLGGLLTTNPTTIGDLNGAYDFNIYTKTRPITLRSESGVVGTYSALQVSGLQPQVSLNVVDSGNTSDLIVSRNYIRFTDQIHNKGAEYAADYSANYTNRSLVDKEYVDTLVNSSVTASNGLTKTGNDIQLGGLLTADTFINKSGHSMRFNGDGFFQTQVFLAGQPYYTNAQQNIDSLNFMLQRNSDGLQNSL